MIRLDGINKVYPTRSGPVQVLRDVNLHDRARRARRHPWAQRGGQVDADPADQWRRVADQRHDRAEMSVSWPLAFGGAFQGSLTGYDNLRFICRIYGVDPDDKMSFVEEFSELGIYLREPLSLTPRACAPVWHSRFRWSSNSIVF